MRDAKTLQGCPEQIESEAVLAVAAFVTGGDGVKTRLIDNILLSRNPDHLEDLLDFVHRK
jgi:pantothenate synthetase